MNTMFFQYLKTMRHRRHAAIFAVGHVERLPGLVHCAGGEFGEAVAGEPDNRWRMLPAHEASFFGGHNAQVERP